MQKPQRNTQNETENASVIKISQTKRSVNKKSGAVRQVGHYLH